MRKLLFLFLMSIMNLLPLIADSKPPKSPNIDEQFPLDKRYGISTYLQEDKLVFTFDDNIGIIQCSVINTNTSEAWSAEIDSSTGYYIMDFTNTPGVYIFTLHTDTGSYSCSFILT